MRAIGRAWRSLRRWLGGWFEPSSLRVQHVLDEPETRRQGVLYVVGEPKNPWLAVMSCPCRCGEAIHLNLLSSTRPRWTLATNPDGRVSLSPSVWRTAGCRSHFFVRDGRIQWVRRR
jgi:hypothetical protein